jgi:hypothetical protein
MVCSHDDFSVGLFSMQSQENSSDVLSFLGNPSSAVILTLLIKHLSSEAFKVFLTENMVYCGHVSLQSSTTRRFFWSSADFAGYKLMATLQYLQVFERQPTSFWHRIQSMTPLLVGLLANNLKNKSYQ